MTRDDPTVTPQFSRAGYWLIFRARSVAGRRRGRGMTLPEVMTGAVVLALVLGGSLLVLRQNFFLLGAARDLNFASQIMQGEIERTRLRSWAVVSAYAAGPTTLTLDSTITSNVQIGNRFVLTRTASVVRAGVVELTFTTRWTGVDGRVQARSARMWYAQNGLYDWFYSES